MIKKLSVEKLFIIIALFFGFLYLILLPPFQSVDENTHFYRSYEILQGNIVSKKINTKVGNYLPTSLEKLALDYSFLIKNVDKKININYILNSSKIKLEPNKTKFIEFNNTALYSPICYSTQLPAMYIANFLNANPLLIFYLGRISNLIFFTLLGYLILKTLPFYKLPAALLLLMPMTLSLGASLTSDVIVIGVNFLWVALLMKILAENKIVNYSKILILFLLAFILALAKNYFMLVPLIFILPKSKFKNLLQYLICTLGVLAITGVFALIWYNMTTPLIHNLNQNANYTELVKFILTHPIKYAFILLGTFVFKLGRLIITMIGVLGWQDTPLDFLTYILYPILIIFSIISERKTDFELKNWQKLIIFCTLIFATAWIFTSVYLIYSKIGAYIIMGLNGKYFTPFMLPFLLLFQNKFYLQEKYQRIVQIGIFIALILILLSSDLSLINRFYDMTPNLHYKV